MRTASRRGYVRTAALAARIPVLAALAAPALAQNDGRPPVQIYDGPIPLVLPLYHQLRYPEETLGPITPDRSQSSPEGAGSVDIVSANPPLTNLVGAGSFIDPLQPGPGPAITQGIGDPPSDPTPTPNEGSITYGVITFMTNATPMPPITTATVTCSGQTVYPCPSVVSITGSGTGPYTVTLDGPIPPGQCTAIKPNSTNPGQGLQYRYVPGDINGNGSFGAIDSLTLVNRMNGFTALPCPPGPCMGNYCAVCDINRSNSVAPNDVLRLVTLANGINTTQVWRSINVSQATCPPL